MVDIISGGAVASPCYRREADERSPSQPAGVGTDKVFMIDIDIDDAIARASFLATWSGACGFKRARDAFLADLVINLWAKAGFVDLDDSHARRPTRGVTSPA